MIQRKRRAPVLVGVGVAAALLASAWPRHRPNVVVIVVDTLRADAVSVAAGNPKTPGIAELASDGVPFALAFAHAPMTLPAHASLFSGQLPAESGVLGNGQRVPAELPLLAERLAAEGYQTSAVVSLATLWPEAAASGLDRGFQRYDQGTLEVSPGKETTRRFETALELLDPEQPFFLFAHLADPHEPYTDNGESGRHAEVRLDGKWLAMLSTSRMSYWEFDLVLEPGVHELSFGSNEDFKLRSLELTSGGQPQDFAYTAGSLLEATRDVRVRVANRGGGPLTLHARAWLNDVPSLDEARERYRAEVARADRAIQALIDGLKRRGLYEDTLFVVTSDHGEALGEHGTVGHVVSLYDELLHVPLVVRLPRGRFDKRLAATREELVRHVDLVPTILEELGLDPLPGASGRSLFEPGPRTLIAETHPPEAPRALYCVRDDQYKLIYAPDEDAFEMYRLGPDPLELDDVFHSQGSLRQTWQLVLRKLAAEAAPEAERGLAMRAKLSALGY